MKHYLLLLTLGIVFMPNISYCASADSSEEETSSTLVDIAFKAVGAYEKFSNLISMIDNIDALVNKTKLVEIAKRIKVLKLQQKTAAIAKSQKIEREINTLKLFYLTAINPDLLVKILIKAKYLNEETSEWLVILLKALNTCQLGETEKLFLILGLNPQATMAALSQDPIDFIAPIALPVVTHLANPNEVPEALQNETLTQAIEKYNSVMEQENQLAEIDNQITGLKQTLQKLTSNIESKQAELKVYEQTLEEMNTFQNLSPNAKLEELELDLDNQRETLATEIETLKTQLEMQKTQTTKTIKNLNGQQEELLEALAEALEADELNKDQTKRIQQWQSEYNIAIKNNIINFIILQLGETILLKGKETKAFIESIELETQKLLKNKNASTFFPWTMLIAEQDFLNALDAKIILKLHHIIFGYSNPEAMCTVIDSIMPEKYCTARKALFEIEVERLNAAHTAAGKTGPNSLIAFSRMATYAPSLVYKSTRFDDATKEKYTNLLKD